ncbi:probable LRR receptor-like serine/threonine-protein kinase At1g56130 [Selaginella moellendorffii]|nr:probable LRR receptor-like serine/threonine-protein kinase At1g56130 [Selaginella moellendorffii]|eukprot:XP_002983367.2 probable LRR receptor-like serine/threonine-protein kinase At1g56130 [Selaginella moellendorffii]
MGVSLGAAALWVLLFFIAFHGRAAAQATTTTDPDELAALRILADSLRISKFWNFSVDPCSGLNGWNNTATANSFNNPITGIECNCGRGNSSLCHVTRIVVVSMNAAGQIPPEIGNFPQLNDLNLAQNVLTGRLPDEIGSLSNLQYLTVGINKLSGPLPSSLGRLTNLVSIGFGSNDFSGTLPREIGNLQSLRKIYMDACNLGGELPEEFGNLTSLEILWMAGNNFNGTFPEFIGRLVALQDLKMHGNNFQGPIPSSLGNLRNIKTLDLGDITSGGAIPSSLNMLSGINKLMLRNCELSGSIPDLGNLSTLAHLDLSFNNLTGVIPSSLWAFPSLQNLLLGSNRLTGPLPSQLASRSLQRLDVSFNELSGPMPSWISRIAQANTIWNQFNLNPDIRAAASNCLQSRANCSRVRDGRSYQFAINCGGPQITSSSGTMFSEDTAMFTMGTFTSNDQAWVVGSTGYSDGFVRAFENTTVPVLGTVDRGLYQTSRSAPSSLRYIGLGMVNGAYTLEFHFAEIQLDNSTTWLGITRRLFDIYLQGTQRVKDFNIQNEAGGSSRALVRTFRNVEVTNNVLDMHFVWRGKGTCCYGPLVAAIRVTPVFSTAGLEAPGSKSKSSKAVAMGVGIGAAVLFVILFAVFLIVKRQQRRLKALLEDEDLKHLEGKPDLFTYNELKNAARNFSSENKLGQGGFGAVYKGVLPNGTVVAIKELSSKSQQGSREFLNEVTVISSVQHRNLVKLHGCCIDGDHRLLVYEFLENNSLHHVLLSSRRTKPDLLNWPTRFSICLGIARGLSYLHEDSKPKIVHRDIKAHNVLLDRNMTPKIADFGLAKLFQDHETHVSTRVAGTIGYLSPEYAMRGQLTEKADVYSFGVLALEIVSGRSNLDTSLPADMVYLLEWAWNLYERKQEMDMVDKELTDVSQEEAARVIKVALLCSHAVASSRPAMSHVVAMLVGTSPVDVSSLRPGYSALKDAAPGFFSDSGGKDRSRSVDSVDQPSSSSANTSYVFSSQASQAPLSYQEENSIVEAR